MAPRTRAKRRRNNTSALDPSADAASENANQLSIGENTNDGRLPKNGERETLATESYVMVLGEQMLVPQAYDPDTYDPDRRMPYSSEPEPEPELYDPETYTSWGRKHFGEEWYALRKTMLEERDIYQNDPVYSERQRTLRIMEHKAERRPFKPGPRAGEMKDAGWKRMWARLSREPGIEVSRNSPSPTPSKDSNDSDTDLSGYSTYPPTPEPREPTPLPDDPWERLEYNRRRFEWDGERYYFERTFLREALIDWTRTRYEDEPGDQQIREKREKKERFRWVDEPRFSLEKRRFEAYIDLPKKGWTAEQIDAAYDADVSLLEWRRKNPEPKGSGPHGQDITPVDKAATDVWLQKLDAARIRVYGELPPKGSGPGGLSATEEERGKMELWRKNTHARVSRQKTKGVLRQTHNHRVTKNGPSHASNNIQTSPQRRNWSRKTYTKERASRRIAKMPPEYGMLVGRGKAETPVVAKSAKSPAVSKSGQARPGRPKLLAKARKAE
ncbi:hypothetical protein F5X97DRAFT_137343 [Nemania serpens]|nr:hypothetical protein F5X97DRAFT_137343 [Nemania serpens]